MADKREQIEAAAADAIRKSGLNSVSFRTLADEVGVKSSSVHYHFPTKADLARSVVDAYTDGFVERLAEIERRQDSLVGKLDGVIDVFAEVTAADTLCLCGMMSAELANLDDSTRTALRTFYERFGTWLTRVFDQHADELTGGMDAKTLAQIFIAGLEGAALVDRTHGGQESLDSFRALARALAAH